MKRTIFTFTAIGFVIFWFIIGFRIWPYMEWLTGIDSFYFPAILGILFLLGFQIHLIKIFPKRLKESEILSGIGIVICRFLLLISPIALLLGIADVFSMRRLRYKYHLLWLPFIFANLLWLSFYPLGFMCDSFEGNYCNGHSYLFNKGFIINRYGNVLFHTSGRCYDFIDIEKGLVVVEEDERKGIYSLEMNEYVVPVGQSLKVSTQTYKKGGYYGLISNNGCVILPAIYQHISYITPNNLCLKTEKGYELFAYDMSPAIYKHGYGRISAVRCFFRHFTPWESIKFVSSQKKNGRKSDNYYIELEDEDKCILYRVNDYEWDKVWDNGYSGKGYHNVSEVYENDDELRFVVLNKYDNSCLINEDNEVLFCAEENWDRIVWLEGREEFECGRSRYYSWDGELLRKED